MCVHTFYSWCEFIYTRLDFVIEALCHFYFLNIFIFYHTIAWYWPADEMLLHPAFECEPMHLPCVPVVQISFIPNIFIHVHRDIYLGLHHYYHHYIEYYGVSWSSILCHLCTVYDCMNVYVYVISFFILPLLSVAFSHSVEQFFIEKSCYRQECGLLPRSPPPSLCIAIWDIQHIYMWCMRLQYKFPFDRKMAQVCGLGATINSTLYLLVFGHRLSTNTPLLLSYVYSYSFIQLDRCINIILYM